MKVEVEIAYLVSFWPGINIGFCPSGPFVFATAADMRKCRSRVGGGGGGRDAQNKYYEEEQAYVIFSNLSIFVPPGLLTHSTAKLKDKRTSIATDQDQ
jgi:hypothetical protein